MAAVRFAPVLLLLAVVASPDLARAQDDPSVRLEVDTGYACFAADRRFHGLYGGLEAMYAFNGFWAIRGGITHGEHRSKGDAFSVTQATLGARYQLDVFTYVPWVDVSGASYAAGGTDSRDLSAGYALGFGFDYLLDPTWSLGFAGRYHQVFGNERFPAYVTLGARLGYRWTLGDPFAR